MKIRTIIISCLAVWAFQPSNAQELSDIDNAIANGDFFKVASYGTQNKSLENYAIDAFCGIYNPDDNSYEDVLRLYQICDKNSQLGKFILSIKTQKEQSVRRALTNLTLEEIVDYNKEYPQRQQIVQEYLDSTLAKDLKDLSYLELNYVKTQMPEFHKSEIRSEISSRGEERKALLAGNVGTFLSGERNYTPQIQYVIEKIVWSFFIEGHRQLTHAYSQIPMVPDNAGSAASQYQQLVKICLSPSELQRMLQKEVNKYCEQVNKARKDYALIAGIKEYPKMSYTVPLISLNSNVSYNCLYNIGQARQTYIQSRQNVSQGSGVIGWITGGLWGLGVKAIGDWLSISDLVDAEYKSRLEYVENVYGALYTSFKKYAANTSSQIKTTLTKSEAEYEKCIKQ